MLCILPIFYHNHIQLFVFAVYAGDTRYFVFLPYYLCFHTRYDTSPQVSVLVLSSFVIGTVR